MAGVRRRRRLEKAGRITQEAIAAFKAGDVIALQRALRLPPWQVSPLTVAGKCPWPPGSGGAITWVDSVGLREALNGHG